MCLITNWIQIGPRPTMVKVMPRPDRRSRAGRAPRPFACLLTISLSATLIAGIGALDGAEPRGDESPPNESLAQLEEAAIKAAVAKVSGSVVQLQILAPAVGVEGGLENAPTTGIVVSSDGYVLSSAVPFVDDPTSIIASLPDNTRVPARLIARDYSRMLAVLKIESPQSLVVPDFVPRSELVVGQWALALGRSSESGVTSVSVGVVSATQRIWGKALQTDAKVSPSNYGGPLVDITGRVLGILVPLSPHEQDVSAGIEWYDSGIGFAIPLAEFTDHLEKLKQGIDLRAGLMGLAFKSADPYAAAPVIQVCHPNSPAAKAGLKAGDRITEFQGLAVNSEMQLKHQVGALYAGDPVRVRVLRENRPLDFDFTLADKILPYEHAFLGILPRRDVTQAEQGVAIRYVYAGSPAEKAKLLAGDYVVACHGQPISTREELLDSLDGLQPGATTSITVRRGAQKQEITSTIVLGSLPTSVPESLPISHEPPQAAPKGDAPPATGRIEIRTPDSNRKCLALVPSTYQPDVPHGVMVWLHPPGQYAPQTLELQWKTLGEQHDLIVLAPQAEDESQWFPTEVADVRRMLEELMNQYQVDRRRIIVHGYQGGGAMASLVALSHRDVVRGLATVDAPLPGRLVVPANDPFTPLACWMAAAKQSPRIDAIQLGIKRLRAEKYPVTDLNLGDTPRYLEQNELQQLAQWIDSLDRL